MTSEPANTCVQTPRAEQIALLNDKLRKTGLGGAITVTRSVRLLEGFCPQVLMIALGNYNRFDHHNDPHGERDFGDLTLFGADLLWKIDYYDNSLQYGSDDPADALTTQRILTVMLPSEY